MKLGVGYSITFLLDPGIQKLNTKFPFKTSLCFLVLFIPGAIYVSKTKKSILFSLIWGKATDFGDDLIHRGFKLRTASAVSWGEKRSRRIRWKSR